MNPASPCDFRSLDDLRLLPAPALMQFFTAACSHPEAIQRAVLMDIIRRNAQTEFGRTRGFNAIRTIEDYRRQVPVADWEHFEPLAKRMETGETNLLFAGIPRHFIATSGTTGALKHVPESPEGALAKSLVSRLRIALLAHIVPAIQDGTFVPLANATSLGRTPAGIPIGFASGFTLADSPPGILRHMAFPPAAMNATHGETLDYLILRFALARPNVRMLIGNNPGRMTGLLEQADLHRDRLLDDIEHGTLSETLDLAPDLRALLQAELTPDPERARTLRRMAAARGRLDPRDYWPELALVACWLGGTIGRYLEGLQPWLPASTVFADIGYGASEGKFNIPIHPGTAAAPLALFAGFFEFLPVDSGEPLLAHELTDGHEYLLLLTSYSGLYRYNLHDIIKVSGVTGRNPHIEFVSKTGEFGNLAGEKLSGAFVSDVVRHVSAARNLRWRHFCAVANAGAHGYDFCVEPEGSGSPDAGWTLAVDRLLAERHPLYALRRRDGLLRPPRLLAMKPGWLDRLYAEHLRPGVTTTQIKLPVICNAVPLPEFVACTIEP